MHDLLCDPLIGVRTPTGERRVSLPDLLAALSAKRIEGYTGLRAHQADPWHVFLVQLAASIQARRPTHELPTDPAYWREGLLDLADGKASAWHLIWEDVTQPAFMQHPWKGREAEATDYGIKTVRGNAVYDAKATTPDELDVLVTARNHDLKMARISPADAEAWIFALVLLQTTSGFLGQGNYGIVRMNGGFASRSIISWTPSRQPSERFRHEVELVVGLRADTIRTHGYAERGVVLTWLTPWRRDGHQFTLDDLEPWFIEAPRALRLVRDVRGAIIVLGATSKARQIGPRTLESGDVGDPWTAINARGPSALTLSAEGFTPQRLTDLLFEQGFELTPLQKPRPGEGHGWFIASCLVRGQGTTKGFHRVELPVPSKVRRALGDAHGRDQLAKLAQALLTDAKDVQNPLATALAVLCEGGPEKADFDRVKSWLEAARKDFIRRWEASYFPTLWRGADEHHDTVRSAWQQALVTIAQAVLDEATQWMPLPTGRTWRAVTQAQRTFIGLLRKHDLPLPGRVSARDDAPTMEDIPA